jgi:hypothetical protein
VLPRLVRACYHLEPHGSRAPYLVPKVSQSGPQAQTPKVDDYWLPKALMDGVSTINIFYVDTFRRLNLPSQ